MTKDASPGSIPASRWVFALPVILTVVLSSFAFLTPARQHSGLIWTFCGVSAALLIWLLLLRRQANASGRTLSIAFVPIKAHYIQATLHLTIFAYWGFYWRPVYEHAHLIVAQIIFLYLFDMLLCWSRRDQWRLGFGPLPIILSTNLFLLFKEDWFVFQFAMVATGALGKEFIKWNREGRRTHIFNPSGLSLSLFSIALILTGTTENTWGIEIATTLNAPPHIYLWIFAVGLIVQYFFSVTLMTLSAAAALWIFNLIYTQATGVYFFIDSNIPIAVFLGLHLLVTDPSTSPRTNLGRVIFGGLYALAVIALYALLELGGAPQFYDKLLCVPLLNLSVIFIDRIARRGLLGRLTQWFDSKSVRTLNLFHMALWIAVFAVMLRTGFVHAPHPGSDLEFWEKACADGKRHACAKYLRTLDYQASVGSADACNRLGIVYVEGKIVDQSGATAAEYFNRGCELGGMGGCCNLVNLYVQFNVGDSEQVHQALNRLERAVTDEDLEGRNSFFVALAYDHGRGKPRDKHKALAYYQKSSAAGWLDGSIRLASMLMGGEGVPPDLPKAAQALEKAAAAGDPGSAFNLSGLLYRGDGIPADKERAMIYLRQAAQAGLPAAQAKLRELEQLGEP